MMISFFLTKNVVFIRTNQPETDIFWHKRMRSACIKTLHRVPVYCADFLFHGKRIEKRLSGDAIRPYHHAKRSASALGGGFNNLFTVGGWKHEIRHPVERIRPCRHEHGTRHVRQGRRPGQNRRLHAPDRTERLCRTARA